MKLCPIWLALGVAVLAATYASAQTAPPVFLENTRRIQGDRIQVCVDDFSVGAAFDKAVSQAIGDALFLEVIFKPAPTGFPINGIGYLEEIQIAMNDTCDMLAGISLQAGNPFPDWATVTRAYASVPYVLAVVDPGFDSLADIPKDRRIGTALGSAGEWAFINTMSQRRESQRWGRLPYADADLMLRRLRDGSIAGMMLWQPTLAGILADDPNPDDVRLIASDPVPQAVARVGGLISGRDSFLRTKIDDAIEALIADGTIAAIMDEFGYAGTPGG